MLFDTHVHSNPGSICSQVALEEMPAIFKNAGYGGFMLTNHFYEKHLSMLGQNFKEQKENFISIYRHLKEKSAEYGLKVLLGAEVKVTDERADDSGLTSAFRPEFLLFGLTEKILLDAPTLFKFTQKELYEFAEDNGMMIYQAHPFRTAQGYYPADMRYIHGIEVFNGHPNFPAETERSLALAKDNNKLQSAGSDMHVAFQCGSAAMVLPDDIDDSTDLCAFLKTNTPKSLDIMKKRIFF